MAQFSLQSLTFRRFFNVKGKQYFTAVKCFLHFTNISWNKSWLHFTRYFTSYIRFHRIGCPSRLHISGALHEIILKEYFVGYFATMFRFQSILNLAMLHHYINSVCEFMVKEVRKRCVRQVIALGKCADQCASSCPMCLCLSSVWVFWFNVLPQFVGLVC